MKYQSLILSFLMFCIISCNSNKNSTDGLTKQTAMDSLVNKNPVEGAKFYKANREKYSFMDSLYNDSIVPVLPYCNYYDLKEIRVQLENTPFHNLATELYQNVREKYAKEIESEINKNAEIEKKAFESSILPAIEMTIDSMLDEDIGKAFSEYAGGILNYRKLNFLLGRNRNDFKEMFWDKVDTLNYQEKIREHIQVYFDMISSKQNDYCQHVIGKAFKGSMKMNNPTIRIGLSKSTLKHIQKYTSGQTDEIIQEAVKDYVVPLALAGASGGVSTLYDIGNTVYDIKVTLDEINNTKIYPDDMVKYVCAHDLSYQIENFYLNKCLKIVKREIDRSNKELYEFIMDNL